MIFKIPPESTASGTGGILRCRNGKYFHISGSSWSICFRNGKYFDISDSETGSILLFQVPPEAAAAFGSGILIRQALGTGSILTFQVPPGASALGTGSNLIF